MYIREVLFLIDKSFGGKIMSKTDRILEGLLTGDRDQDNRLRKAFELGIRHGQASDREMYRRIIGGRKLKQR